MDPMGNTLRIQVFPKNPGFPLQSYSGDGIFRPISPTRLRGVWILRDRWHRLLWLVRFGSQILCPKIGYIYKFNEGFNNQPVNRQSADDIGLRQEYGKHCQLEVGWTRWVLSSCLARLSFVFCIKFQVTNTNIIRQTKDRAPTTLTMIVFEVSSTTPSWPKKQRSCLSLLFPGSNQINKLYWCACHQKQEKTTIEEHTCKFVGLLFQGQSLDMHVTGGGLVGNSHHWQFRMGYDPPR